MRLVRRAGRTRGNQGGVKGRTAKERADAVVPLSSKEKRCSLSKQEPEDAAGENWKNIEERVKDGSMEKNDTACVTHVKKIEEGSGDQRDNS